jgi:preprotein translocase subunit SecE
MAMNRETKRMLQRQGAIGADGEAKPQKKQAPAAPRPKEQRTSPKQFVKEVRGEMRKVAWPTRAEVINYSIIVFITLVIMTALIAAIDFGASKAVLWIIDS